MTTIEQRAAIRFNIEQEKAKPEPDAEPMTWDELDQQERDELVAIEAAVEKAKEDA